MIKSEVYLINLESSVERFVNAKKQLDFHGISFQHVRAVDGRARDPGDFDKYSSVRSIQYLGRPMLGPEVACFLSHLKCVERFLKSHAELAVVLEDDLQFDYNFLDTLSSAFSSLEQHYLLGWDLINIGNHRLKLSSFVDRFGIDACCYELRHAHYFPSTTNGLVWSRSGARAFVDSVSEIYAPIDVFLRSWQGKRNKGFAFSPSLVHVSGAASDINGSRKDKKMLGRGLKKYYANQRRIFYDNIAAVVFFCRAKFIGIIPNSRSMDVRP